MNIDTLLSSIMTGIAEDVAVNTWTMANFERMVTVCKGIDINNEPVAASYPIVHLFLPPDPLAKETGYDREKIIHRVGITCGIYSDSSTTSEVAVDGFEGTATTVVFAGIALIEAFRKLVETAVVAVIEAAGLLVDNLEIGFETISSYPFFIAGMIVETNQELYQGSDVFA